MASIDAVAIDPPPDTDHLAPQSSEKAQASTSYSNVVEAVEALTRFARQKPGGTFSPIFKSSTNCLLCSKGAVCFGSSCLGQEPHSHMTSCQASWCPTIADESSSSPTIPGLTGNVHLTTLVDLKLGNSSIKAVPAASKYPAFGQMFGWKKEASLKDILHLRPNLAGGNKKPTNKITKRHIPVSNNCSMTVYNRKFLQSFLLRSGARAEKAKATISSQSSPI